MTSLVHHASGHHPVFRPQTGVAVKLLFGGHGCQVLLLEVEPWTRCDLGPHDGEEIRYVIDGTVVFAVGGTERALAAGDTLHHPSTQPHGFRTGEARATFLTVVFSREYDVAALSGGAPEGESTG